MIVYHGSTDVISNPLAHIGRNHLDFGKGFYVTSLQHKRSPGQCDLPTMGKRNTSIFTISI